jgi:hypothetical protein
MACEEEVIPIHNIGPDNFFLYMDFSCLNDPMYDSKLRQFFIMVGNHSNYRLL